MSSSVGMMTWPQYDGKVMSSSHVPVTTNQILWFSHGFPTVPVTTNQLCMAPTRSPRYPSPSPSPWIPVSCKAGHCCTRSCAVAWIFLRETTAFYHLRPGLFLQICQTKKKSWDHWDKLGRHQVLWLIDMLIWSYTIIIVHWQIQ